MYDRVVVRALELIDNLSIAQRLHNSEEDFTLFTELVSNGCVEILTTHPRKYPDDLTVDPHSQPVTARVQDHAKHRTFAGRRWRPEKWQWKLAQRLDDVVSHNKSTLTFARKYPKENLFAERLAEILERRESYSLSSIPEFSGIDPGTADLFIQFCRVPEAYKRFLRKKRIRKFDRDEFFRSELYRCANPDYFPEDVCRKIINLGQSVYMDLECDREGLVGRWGEALREPPHAFLSDESVNAKESVVRLQPGPDPYEALKVPIGKGLGRALLETRRSKAFENFQYMIATLGKKDGVVAESAFNIARDNLASGFADNAARHMIPRNRIESWLLRLGSLAREGVTLGWCIKQVPVPEPIGSVTRELGSELEHMAEGIAVASHGGFHLSRLVRSAIFLPSAREAAVRSMTVRRTTIDWDED
jgi:hypothetical protein